MSVWLNDALLTDVVENILVLDGHLAPIAPTPAVLQLANAPSVVGSQVTVGSRTITLGLDLRPTDYANRQAILDSLRARLGLGLLELRTMDLPDRVLRVVYAGAKVDLYTGAHAALPVYLELSFAAADPARSDVEPRVLGLSTSRVACALGTETVAPRLWLYGSATNVAVIARNAAGAETHRLTLTGVLATNDALVIDCARQTIDRYVAGALQTGTSAGLGWLTSGTFPLLSPEDASGEGGPWPTLELTASSGTPTGLVAYHRRW